MGIRAASSAENAGGSRLKRPRRGKRPRPEFHDRDYDRPVPEVSGLTKRRAQLAWPPQNQDFKQTPGQPFRTPKTKTLEYRKALGRSQISKRVAIRSRGFGSKGLPQKNVSILLDKINNLDSTSESLCAGVFRVEMRHHSFVWHGSTWSVDHVQTEVDNMFKAHLHPHRGMQQAYDEGERRIDIKVVEKLGMFRESSHDPAFYASDPSAMQSNNEVDKIEKRLQQRLEIHERKFLKFKLRSVLVAWRKQKLEPAFLTIKTQADNSKKRGQTAAAMQIQRAYRGHFVRNNIHRLRRGRAQTRIAAQVRRRHALRNAHRLRLERYQRNAATKIQCFGRKIIAKRMLQKARKCQQKEDAAFTIQQAWRNCVETSVARKIMQAHKRQKAALCVTQFMRMAAAMKKLENLRLERCALRIQTRWRCRQGKLHVHFRRLRKIRENAGAIEMQRIIRGRQARRRAKHARHTKRELCALRIQARWRAKHAQLGYFLIRRERERCAYIIQKFYRKFAVIIHLRNQQRERAARIVQRAYRAKQLRIYHKVWSIQRKWRHHCWYKQRKGAIIQIQAFIRLKLQHYSFCQQKKAVLILQRAVRSHAARCMLSALRERRNRLEGMPLCDECNDEVCAVYCRACEGKFCRSCMHVIHGVLKDHEKAHLNSKEGIIFSIQWSRDHISAAIRVQRAWRRRITRILNLAAKYKLERRQHALSLAGMRWRLHAKRTKNAKAIQAIVRGHLARKRAAQRRRAVVQMQSVARAFVHKRRYHMLRMACIHLQAKYRSIVQRAAFLKKKQAAILIQSQYRRWLERSWFVEQRDASIQIQAAARGWTQRLIYIKKKSAIIKMQAVVRGMLVRRFLLRARTAATRIQAIIRGTLAKIYFKKQKEAAVRIQCNIRGYLVRRSLAVKRSYLQALMRANAMNKDNCARKIQKLFRFYIARKRAALRIQRQWRRNQGAYTAFLVQVARNAANDEDRELECAWTRHWDTWNEKTYYFNSQTMETCFEKPIAYVYAERERNERRLMLHEEMHMRKIIRAEIEQEKLDRRMNQWSVHVDETSGVKYYENTAMGISTWERPKVLGPDPDEPLWKVYMHPALNRPFYVNRDTQEARWERPIEDIGYEYAEYWDYNESKPYWMSSITGEWTYIKPEEYFTPEEREKAHRELTAAERQAALDDTSNQQWFEAFDEESGRPYYYCWNKFTNTTEEVVWEKPDALRRPEENWDEYYSAIDGASYYVNKNTGESTWKRPW